MLPGKTYSPEEALGLLRKRLWLLIVPVAVVAAVTSLVARRLPDFFRSETTIMVVPQRVPDAFVKSTVSSRLEDRLQTIKPTILSRTSLEPIIKDFDLYPDERKRMVLEDVVELMRSYITVDTIRGDAFQITYVGRNPRKVMDVTNRLANLFIDASLKDRAVLAEGTDQFLESELLLAKERLIENEKRLEVYQREHAGELPSQFESNLQQVKNAQAQVQAATDAINRLVERRTGLDRRLAELENPTTADSPSSGASAPPSGVVALAQQLSAAEALLKVQETRFRPGHPDLEQTKRNVADLRAQLDAATSSNPNPTRATLSAAEVTRRARIAETRQDMQEVDRQIAKSRDDEQRFRQIEAEAQKRVDALPTRQSELVELTRDYSTIDNTYKNLAAKKEEAQISANLERRQVGEQFRLLDPARLSERPVSPNRAKILTMAILASLGLSMAVVALLEYRDRSFRTDTDVASVLNLPVLAVVPLMRSEDEQRRHRWAIASLNTGLGALVAVCLAIVMYTVAR